MCHAWSWGLQLPAFVSCGSGQSALHRGCRAHCGNNGFWEQLVVIPSGRERGVTLIPLSPPRKAGYIFQWPEEQCGAVAATWEKKRLLKQNPLAVIFQRSSRNEELTLTFTSLLAPVHALSSIPRPGAAFACSSAAPARHCV